MEHAMKMIASAKKNSNPKWFYMQGLVLASQIGLYMKLTGPSRTAAILDFYMANIIFDTNPKWVHMQGLVLLL